MRARRRPTPRRRARVRATPPAGRGGLRSSAPRAAPTPRSAAEAPPGSANSRSSEHPAPPPSQQAPRRTPHPPNSRSSLLSTSTPSPAFPPLQQPLKAPSTVHYFTSSANLPERIVPRVSEDRTTHPRSARETRRTLLGEEGEDFCAFKVNLKTVCKLLGCSRSAGRPEGSPSCRVHPLHLRSAPAGEAAETRPRASPSPRGNGETPGTLTLQCLTPTYTPARGPK